MSGTTLASDGFWAPDGLYNAYVAPLIFVAWIVVLSVLQLRRVLATAEAPQT